MDEEIKTAQEQMDEIDFVVTSGQRFGLKGDRENLEDMTKVEKQLKKEIAEAEELSAKQQAEKANFRASAKKMETTEANRVRDRIMELWRDSDETNFGRFLTSNPSALAFVQARYGDEFLMEAVETNKGNLVNPQVQARKTAVNEVEDGETKITSHYSG